LWKIKEMPTTPKLAEPMIAYSAKDDNDILSLIEAVRNGISYSFFSNLVRISPFSLPEWSYFLHLSERTLQRYKKEKKNFGPVYSEKILEITMLYKYGKEVFGDEKKFSSWLDSNNIALGNIKPKGLLDNSFGIDMLKNELSRIEQGVLA
jgi:putative toxin-antitoxin system antitoxin component (TIGR02293 family)